MYHVQCQLLFYLCFAQGLSSLPLQGYFKSAFQAITALSSVYAKMLPSRHLTCGPASYERTLGACVACLTLPVTMCKLSNFAALAGFS